jgi:anti-sigma28 factor (negative regulator of flagellin synthesis)
VSKLTIALFAAGLSFTGASLAQVYAPKTDSTPTSKDNYTAAKSNEETPSARENASLANAQASYNVPVEQCAEERLHKQCGREIRQQRVREIRQALSSASPRSGTYPTKPERQRVE